MDSQFTIDMLVTDMREGDKRRDFSGYISSLAHISLGKIKAVGSYKDQTRQRMGGSLKRMFVVVDREFFENADVGLSPRARALKAKKKIEYDTQLLIASSLALQNICLGWGNHA